MKNYDCEVEKIYYRQENAIEKFGFLTIPQLVKFCNKADKNENLVNEYFNKSTGYSNDLDHQKVSRKLASFIKKSIK